MNALQGESCELVCLQIGPDRDAADALNLGWDHALAPAADFFELGQTMKRCDLIITVDTAAAHLAGALGIPAWVLLPWAAAARWGRDSQHSILYRSLRLFRQRRPRDWTSVIAAVHAAYASGPLNPSSISSNHDVSVFSLRFRTPGRGKRPPRWQLVRFGLGGCAEERRQPSHSGIRPDRQAGAASFVVVLAC